MQGLQATPAWAGRSVIAVGLVAAGTVVGQPLGLGVMIVLLALGTVAGLVRPPAAIPLVDLRVAELPEPDRWVRAWWVLAAALTCVPFLRAAGWVVVPAMIMATALASLAVTGGARWGQLLAGLLDVWRRLPFGPLLVGVIAARGASARSAVARGALLAGLLLAVFVPMLMSADAAFAQVLEDAVPSVDQPLARIAIGLVFVALGGGLVFARMRPAQVAPRPAGRALGTIEARIALGTLVALFAAFVALQFATLFGGQRHVLETAGLTYAEYARSGFAQLLAVAALTFAVLGAARRWAPHETLLPKALCLLTLVVCVSALHRLQLYEETLGFTRLRLSAHAALLYFAALFVLVLFTRSPRAIVALTAGSVLLFALSDPERRIAEHNVARYERTGEIDRDYLATLGADAVPALNGVVAIRCTPATGIAGLNLARLAC